MGLGALRASSFLPSLGRDLHSRAGQSLEALTC